MSTELPTIRLGDISVDVVLKDIRNVHLSVHPPTGHVRISAPKGMRIDTIRVFAISKLPWIRQQQRELREQERETPRDYVERESHYVWGRRCLLTLIESDAAPSIELKHGRLCLRVRPKTGKEAKRALLDDWYRLRLKEAIPPLLERWQPLLGVRAQRFFVQRMKTRWGSCNWTARTIRLNTELARKPRACLEYLVVHELIHLIEPSHNQRFVALMDRTMPNWRGVRDQLNRLPLRHDDWTY